jgi:hypothetical protein
VKFKVLDRARKYLTCCISMMRLPEDLRSLAAQLSGAQGVVGFLT